MGPSKEVQKVLINRTLNYNPITDKNNIKWFKMGYGHGLSWILLIAIALRSIECSVIFFHQILFVFRLIVPQLRRFEIKWALVVRFYMTKYNLQVIILTLAMIYIILSFRFYYLPPRRDCMDSKMVRTSYNALHLSFNISRQMLPPVSTFGWKQGVAKRTIGALYG